METAFRCIFVCIAVVLAHASDICATWRPSEDFCPPEGSNASGCTEGGYSLLPQKPDWLFVRSNLIREFFGTSQLPTRSAPDYLSTFSTSHRFPSCLYTIWGEGDSSGGGCAKDINVTEIIWNISANVNSTYNLSLQSKVFFTLNTSAYAPGYAIWPYPPGSGYAEQPSAPVLPHRGRTLVIWHNGHGVTQGVNGSCPTFGDTEGEVDWLNLLGYDVAIVMMPFRDCNDDPYGPHDHAWFKQFADQGVPWMRFFIEPVILTINYAKAVLGYSNIVMMGLSGGGWTTTVVPAVDPRITLSMPVAGSTPCDFRHTSWDFEQFCDSPWARTGNYTALYVLAALESGRTSVQMLHEGDPCCFHGCGRHARIRTYNRYVQGQTHGLFQTLVTEGNMHQWNPREKVVASTLIEKIRRGKPIIHYDLDSPFSILKDDEPGETIHVVV